MTGNLILILKERPWRWVAYATALTIFLAALERYGSMLLNGARAFWYWLAIWTWPWSGITTIVLLILGMICVGIGFFPERRERAAPLMMGAMFLLFAWLSTTE